MLELQGSGGSAVLLLTDVGMWRSAGAKSCLNYSSLQGGMVRFGGICGLARRGFGVFFLPASIPILHNMGHLASPLAYMSLLKLFWKFEFCFASDIREKLNSHPLKSVSEIQKQHI